MNDFSFLILGQQSFLDRYRKCIMLRHVIRLPEDLQAEMKTNKDTINCIQMIMQHINPNRGKISLCSPPLQGGQRSDVAPEACCRSYWVIHVLLTRTHEQGGRLSCFGSHGLTVLPRCYSGSPWRWCRQPLKQIF